MLNTNVRSILQYQGTYYGTKVPYLPGKRCIQLKDVLCPVSSLFSSLVNFKSKAV